MNNKNLELIRQKCIEANPEIESRTFQFQNLHIHDQHIRLADVLLAIKQKEDGLTPVILGDIFWGEEGRMDTTWNLHKDDLNEQSEETINFIVELLK